ncbi:MAG: SH3 domain-containing protein [Flavobacteriales bacterium]|nr:SH3 domain-containing protein [Flavobacteriales bacterium]
MRTLSTLLLSLVMVMTSTASVPPDSLNAAAAKAYLAGDHATALVHYTALLEFGISSDLYYNIGNCHYKLGDIALATLHYERALKLAPGDEDLRANLELARARSKDRVNELPGSSLLAQWNRLAGGRDPDHWARISLWSVSVMFVLLAITLFLRATKLRRWVRIMTALSALLAVGAFAMASARHAAITDNTGAIVMVPKVDVRSEPNGTSTVLFVIHKGTKVQVLEHSGAWVEIKLANGTVGWMQEEGLTRI